jgi:catechol 2,3-dioxygenase-like lactoylglutathione lyase family enzyme
VSGEQPGQADAGVINHVGQCVTDLERSRRFYVEGLGFEVERVLEVADDAASVLLGIRPPVGLTALYLRCGSFVLELLAFRREGNPPRAERVFNEPGLTHLSICIEDVAACAARAERLGGSIERALPSATLIRDPDGQLIELLPMSYRRRLHEARTRV